MEVIRVSPIVISPKPIGIFRPWEECPKTLSKSTDNKLYCHGFQGDRGQESFVHETTCVPHDSGYDSDVSLTSPSKYHKTNRKFLSSKAVQLMERWYQENVHHPYPSDEVVSYFAEHGNITKTQVRKWMANKRVRSNNTLSFNGTIHPKRLQRLKKEHASSRLLRHHPYDRTPKKTLEPHFNVASDALLSYPPQFSPLYPMSYLPFPLLHSKFPWHNYMWTLLWCFVLFAIILVK